MKSAVILSGLAFLLLAWAAPAQVPPSEDSPAVTPEIVVFVPAVIDQDEDSDVSLLAQATALPDLPQAHPGGGQMLATRPVRVGPPPRGPGRPFGHRLGKWWKNSEIVQRLQLTEAQVNQIEQTFLEHRLKLIDLRAEVEKQEVRLQPMIEADQPDEAKVGAQIDLLTAARGRLEKANALMMLAIRRTLSGEQWKKLQAIQQERERPGGPMFRGRTRPRPGVPMPPSQPPPSDNP